MTDYYPLIARAVSGLSKNTGEARRTIYERARSALVDQLRGLDPPLPESEITRQRLALEESIRKVESEAARRPRTDSRRAGLIAPGRPSDSPARPDFTKEPGEDREAKPRRAASRFGIGGAPTDYDQAPPPTNARRPAAGPGDESAKAADEEDAPVDTGKPRRPPPGPGGKSERVDPPVAPARPNSDGSPARTRNARLTSDRATLADTGLKGFRDVMVEAETLGEATAQAAKSARRAYAAVPQDVADADRSDAPAPRSALREPPDRSGRGSGGNSLTEEAFEDIVDGRPAPIREEISPAGDRRGGASWRGLIAAALAIFVVLALGATAYWQRDRLKGLLVRTPPAPSQPQETPKPQIKIPDRVNQGTSGSTQPAAPDQNVAAVAQRVVLYEEDPGDPQGKRYVGSVVWNAEPVSPSPGQPAEMAVRANLEIPERRINMTMSVRRNTDKALPASHTIELIFNLPPDFPYGGIANVPGVLMKQAEQTRGAPLAGLAVKVTAGFFLLGLSSAESDKQRNLQLLKERSWFDIPIVYGNGRRAILAVEKGTPGERAFNEAFAAWGE